MLGEELLSLDLEEEEDERDFDFDVDEDDEVYGLRLADIRDTLNFGLGLGLKLVIFGGEDELDEDLDFEESNWGLLGFDSDYALEGVGGSEDDVEEELGELEPWCLMMGR